MRSLIDISDDLQALQSQLEELDGFDVEQAQQISEFLQTALAETGEERDRKLDNYAALISELDARASVRKAEAERLNHLAKVDQNLANRLKERLKWFLESHALTKIQTSRYRLSLVKNGGKVPVIMDENYTTENLPAVLSRVTVVPDIDAIRVVLEAGESLPFARLGDRGTSLRIK